MPSHKSPKKHSGQGAQQDDKKDDKTEEKHLFTKDIKIPSTYDGTPSKLQSFLFDCKVFALDDDIPKKRQSRTILAALTGAAHDLAMIATNYGDDMEHPENIIDALKKNIPTGSIQEETRMTWDQVKQAPNESGAAFLTRFTTALRAHERASNATLPPQVLLNELKRKLTQDYLRQVVHTPLPDDPTQWFETCSASIRRHDDAVRLLAPTYATPEVSAINDIRCFACNEQGHRARNCPKQQRNPRRDNANFGRRRERPNNPRFENPRNTQFCMYHGHRSNHSTHDCNKLKTLVSLNKPQDRVNTIRMDPHEFFKQFTQEDTTNPTLTNHLRSRKVPPRNPSMKTPSTTPPHNRTAHFPPS
jgi:hypothetical protein